MRPSNAATVVEVAPPQEDGIVERLAAVRCTTDGEIDVERHGRTTPVHPVIGMRAMHESTLVSERAACARALTAAEAHMDRLPCVALGLEASACAKNLLVVRDEAFVDPVVDGVDARHAEVDHLVDGDPLAREIVVEGISRKVESNLLDATARRRTEDDGGAAGVRDHDVDARLAHRKAAVEPGHRSHSGAQPARDPRVRCPTRSGLDVHVEACSALVDQRDVSPPPSVLARAALR